MTKLDRVKKLNGLNSIKLKIRQLEHNQHKGNGNLYEIYLTDQTGYFNYPADVFRYIIKSGKIRCSALYIASYMDIDKVMDHCEEQIKSAGVTTPVKWFIA